MVSPHIGQVIDIVHLLCGEGRLGRILHHIDAVRIRLNQRFSVEGVCVAVLCPKTFRILFRYGLHVVIRRQDNTVINATYVLRPINRSRYKGDIPDRDSVIQSLRDLHHGLLTHAIGEKVRLTVQKNGTFKAVRPVIIVRHPPQARLNAADDHRHILITSADQVPVHRRSAVRPSSGLTAGGVGVRWPPFSRHKVMIHHGIHIAAGNEKGQSGTAKNRNAVVILPVRLGKDAHAVPMSLQDPADDRVSKGRVVHISVSCDIDKIRLFDSLLFHLLF